MCTALRLGGFHRSVVNWHEFLSPGEQQRVAFARLLLHAKNPALSANTQIGEGQAYVAEDALADDEGACCAGCCCCACSRQHLCRGEALEQSEKEPFLSVDDARYQIEDSVASSMSAVPVLALLDEAEAALDAAGSKQLLYAASHAATLLVVTHRMVFRPLGGLHVEFDADGECRVTEIADHA